MEEQKETISVLQDELDNVKRAQQKQSRTLAKTKQTADNAYERTENNEAELNRCKLVINRLPSAWKEKEEKGVFSAKEVCCKVLTEVFKQKYTAVHIKDATLHCEHFICLEVDVLSVACHCYEVFGYLGTDNKNRARLVVTFNRRDQRDDVLKKFKPVSVTSPESNDKRPYKISIGEVQTDRQKFVRKAAAATVKCLNYWRKSKIEGHPSTDAQLSGHSDIVVDGKVNNVFGF